MTDTAITRIKQLYYTVTKRTVERDLREAIKLLKSIPEEKDRAKAAVFMDGLSQMRSEWSIESKRNRNSNRSKDTKKKSTHGKIAEKKTAKQRL